MYGFWMIDVQSKVVGVHMSLENVSFLFFRKVRCYLVVKY